MPFRMLGAIWAILAGVALIAPPSALAVEYAERLATAALMAKFYHELWINKKPPIEALREAQLTIYRRPDLIPALAGERGRPDQEKAAKLGPVAPGDPAKKPKHADTKLWAAFVLSGVGR